MPYTVFASKFGSAYHYARSCQSLVNAQRVSDVECDIRCGDDPCSNRHSRIHPIEPMSPEEAVKRKKVPCTTCVPPFLKRFGDDDHGHRPVAGFIDGRAIGNVCVRCTTKTPTGTYGVRWPCTSAVVYGVANREEFTP